MILAITLVMESLFLFLPLDVAAAILPVVKKQHQLLVTLLLCNAAAMEVKLYLLPLVVLIYNLKLHFRVSEICAS